MSLPITSCKDDRVVSTLKKLHSQGIQFGIQTKERFISLNKLEYNKKMVLTYDNNNERKSVHSKTIYETGLQTARWINHLKFINEKGDVILLKDYIGNFQS